jgi:hypothetical protein
VPYNVLPLDAAGASQAIMQLDEVCLFASLLLNIFRLSHEFCTVPRGSI